MLRYNILPAECDEVDSYLEDVDDGCDVGSLLIRTQNLRITVVPDITAGAGLNGTDFDSELDEEMNEWFESYRRHWNSYNRTPALQHRLNNVFMANSQPLLLALKLFANCPEANNLRNKNLALFILETLCDLHKRSPQINANCDDNTRMAAFNFVKTCGIVPLYKSVMDTYELQKIRDILVPKVKLLASEHNYKDAAHWAMLLQIWHLFHVHDIIFPLLLQDKVPLVEEYLECAKDQQLPTVQFLDSLLHVEKSVLDLSEKVIMKHKYENIKYKLLSYRPMSKLVTRLSKKFHFDAQQTPNLNFCKSRSYMKYLYGKYQDGGMSCESYRELIRDSANTKALQAELLTLLVAQDDYDEAIYWVKMFDIPLDACPSGVKSRLEDEKCNRLNDGDKTTSGNEVGEKKTNDNTTSTAITTTANTTTSTSSTSDMKTKMHSKAAQDFLVLNLPADCVILVDSAPIFYDMVANLETYTLIGFDSEWKPSISNDNVVSLLQLATPTKVYLVDCLALHSDDKLWWLLGRKIFNNLEILKIGFAIKQDLLLLTKSLPALQLNVQNRCSCLDLHDLWRRMKYLQVAVHSGESLCALAETCLGKTMDKSNQCSNWANRPLRHDQITYAALDAHCLLDIYKILIDFLLRAGFDGDQIVNELTTEKGNGHHLVIARRFTVSNKDNQQQRLLDAIDVPTTAEATILRSSDVKFLCDHMLCGLLKELRKLGMDCVETKQLKLSDCVVLAKAENRYLLTRDLRYTLFSRELPKAQCILIPNDSNVEQVINLLKYLRIDVQTDRLFSRCINCNYDEFILAQNRDMEMMCLGRILHVGDQRKRSTDYVENSRKLLKFSEKIQRTGLTYRGVKIKMRQIKIYTLRCRRYFYICDNCGVCTWRDAHTISSAILKFIGYDGGAINGGN